MGENLIGCHGEGEAKTFPSSLQWNLASYVIEVLFCIKEINQRIFEVIFDTSKVFQDI